MKPIREIPNPYRKVTSIAMKKKYQIKLFIMLINTTKEQETLILLQSSKVEEIPNQVVHHANKTIQTHVSDSSFSGNNII